jgi:putative methyltransferase (TIGR04325 family)
VTKSEPTTSREARTATLENFSVQFTGPFPNYNEALASSTGYSAESIAPSVLAALDLVEQGKAAMERDGCVLERPQYAYTLLTVLLYLALRNADKGVNVVDFGGSLGSSFFACKHWLGLVIERFRWFVIEQPSFVEIGRRNLQSDKLVFLTDVNHLNSKPDLVLLSGVLMYLEDPYEKLRELLDLKAPYVLIDRTAVVPCEDDIIAVEHVRAPTYEASYPCCFLSRQKLASACRQNYTCIEEFRALDQFSVGFADLDFAGFLLSNENSWRVG